MFADTNTGSLCAAMVIEIEAAKQKGILPIWSGDGKEIFYVGLDGAKYSLISVPVKEQGEGLQVGAPQTLISTMNGIPPYDVSRDGKRILVPQLSQQGSQSVTLVTNFADGLKK
jgi:hypothetical protein